jgi:hypothetical protein
MICKRFEKLFSFTARFREAVCRRNMKEHQIAITKDSFGLIISAFLLTNKAEICSRKFCGAFSQEDERIKRKREELEDRQSEQKASEKTPSGTW